ncbi:tissue factor-like [Girardinichthys multiradiatus]|uniref:tissue factor-like n=1 Tax=Girardinichthys multiradiatus TaxID=208333 RepID=UPI001FAD194B|nr:tissue factor-like [Girardinichthys multiradiatus]
MHSVKVLLYIGAFVTAWSITTDGHFVPTAKNVRWVSLDFQTILTWTVEESEHTYSVLYSAGKSEDWKEVRDCTQTSESECDLTQELIPLDRDYEADIRTESHDFYGEFGMDYDFPHTNAPAFNPYKESNISALEFSLMDLNESTVIINIKHPLISVNVRQKETIKDILKFDLKYKISYYKSGSTGKREKISDSSTANVSGLDAGQIYCFMVAAFIPSRPKANQHGAWSTLQCRDGDTHLLQDLSPGAWVGIIFILITVIIIFITVAALYCRRNQQRHNNLQTSQSSVPI